MPRRRFGARTFLVAGWLMSLASQVVASPVAAAQSEPAVAARTEAVAYGVAVVEHLSMRSRLGWGFEMPEEFVTTMVGDDASAPGWLNGVFWLEAVQAGGDPRTAGSASWEGAEIDPTVEPAAQAEAILAELLMARALADAGRTAAPDEARIAGAFLVTQAKAQADLAITRMRGDDGLYRALGPEGIGGDPELEDQVAMLMALSELVDVLAAEGDPYRDDAFLPWFRQAADDLAAWVSSVTAYEPELEARRLLALTRYGRVAGSAPVDPGPAAIELAADMDQPGAMAVQVQLLTSLAAGSGESLIAETEVVGRRLIEAWRDGRIGDAGHLTAAGLGDLLAGLTALAGASRDPVLEEDAMATFNSIVSTVLFDSGMAPSRIDSSLWDLIGGQLPASARPPLDPGTPPAPLGGVEFDSGTWTAIEGHVDTAGGYRLARALISGLASNEPPAAKDAPDTDTAEGDTSTVVVQSTEFSFLPAEISVKAGSLVRMTLDNLGVVPHNVHIAEADVTVEAAANDTASIEFVAPETPGRYEFVCSLPGHQESGMVGALVVDAPTEEKNPARTAAATIIPPPSEHTTAAILLGIGFTLAMTVFVAGLIRFIRLAEDA